MIPTILLVIYAAIGIFTFVNKALIDEDIWHALASGIIWPMFLVRAIFKIIINL